MTLAAVGLVGLYVSDAVAATQVFRGLWWVAVVAYVFITTMTLLIDPPDTARRSWLEGLTFPGLGALVVMVAAWFPRVLGDHRPPAGSA